MEQNREKVVIFKLGWHEPTEGVVQDISPSGDYIKINNAWYESNDIEILEILRKAELLEIVEGAIKNEISGNEKQD